VICIDPFDGTGTPTHGNTYAQFCDTIERYGVRDKVHETIGTRAALTHWQDPEFDMIFIDGAHDHENVEADIEFALRLLKPNGVLAFHDYRTVPGEHDGSWDPGVTDSVNEMLTHGGQLLSRHGTIAVVKPPIKEPSYGV
jgi:predicted O-methyltransferase YrrM